MEICTHKGFPPPHPTPPPAGAARGAAKGKHGVGWGCVSPLWVCCHVICKIFDICVYIHVLYIYAY